MEDSDAIISPNEYEDNEIQGKTKEHKRQFPKFNENARPEGGKLITGLLFIDKKQLKKAV